MAHNKNYQKIFDFLVKHLQTKELFTREELLSNLEDLERTTIETYWNKHYLPLLVPVKTGCFRVSEIFRKYATLEKFTRYVSQKRMLQAKYEKIDHDEVIIYELFMPLANEADLRESLDALFYKDTILPRLKNIVGEEQLATYFQRKTVENDDEYYERICDWIAARFVGYSIHHVQGRFKTAGLLTLAEAGELQATGKRYLIDETTAMVKFIFPIDEPNEKKIPDLFDYLKDGKMEQDLEQVTPARKPDQDARRIRWMFNVLFVSMIVELVGEDEIWMVESGLRNQVHIWRKLVEE